MSPAVGSEILMIPMMAMYMGRQSQSELCCWCYSGPCFFFFCCCCFFFFFFLLGVDSHPQPSFRALLLQGTTSLRAHFPDEEAESGRSETVGLLAESTGCGPCCLETLGGEPASIQVLPYPTRLRDVKVCSQMSVMWRSGGVYFPMGCLFR